MSTNGNKVFSELSVEQARTRGNLLPEKPDKAVKSTLQVKTGAPDEMDQLTKTTANMVIDTSAKDGDIDQRNELDRLFADTSLKDQVPDTMMPDALGIKLFPYQQYGVRWLAFQENNVDSVPPFWKQRQMGSKPKWWCPITQVYQDYKPAPIRGSILADGK
jgi:SNF2 family DNA or RNA helicase